MRSFVQGRRRGGLGGSALDRREGLSQSSQAAQGAVRPGVDETAVSVDRGGKPGDAAASPTRIKIRFAADADREALRSLARWQHEQTLFGDIPFCDAKFDRLFERWRSNQRHQCVIVAELHGAIVGCLYATAGEYYLGRDVILTTVHAIAVDGRRASPVRRVKVFLQLVRGVKEWSKTRGGRHVMVHTTTGENPNVLGRLMSIAGARFIGGAFRI